MRLLYRPVYAPGFGQILVSKSRTRDRRGPSHAGDDTDKLKPALHTALATAVFTQPRSRALCNDLKNCSKALTTPDSALDTFVECVTNPESDFEGEAGELGIDVSSAGDARVRSQLLALRGCWAAICSRTASRCVTGCSMASTASALPPLRTAT